MEPRVRSLYKNVRSVIFGKDDVVELALTSLLAGGHLLIEDAPGLGKTMLARAIAQSLDAEFKRIQFTPDLLPSDVTGVSVFSPQRQEFEFRAGPIFTHVLLADEINRTSPRTQSSLLESMEEGQVSLDGETHRLPDPFFVIATQNPIELEGTYPLPEAQLDRFLMQVSLGYPSAEDEIRVLAEQIDSHPIERLRPVLSVGDLLRLREDVRRVRLAPTVQRYLVDLVRATRAAPETRLGSSPRGAVALMRASQAHAFLRGREYVPPDSVKRLAPYVLAHRLVLDPHVEYTGLTKLGVLGRVLKEVPVPTLPHDQVHSSTPR